MESDWFQPGDIVNYRDDPQGLKEFVCVNVASDRIFVVDLLEDVDPEFGYKIWAIGPGMLRRIRAMTTEELIVHSSELLRQIGLKQHKSAITSKA